MRAITPKDFGWLRTNFPNLRYDARELMIKGEIDFCACYDKLSNRLSIERGDSDDAIRQASNFITDAYEVEICLVPRSLEVNGWPRVYEVGGRHEEIAQKYGVPSIDLHVDSADSSCCLGIRLSHDIGLTIGRFTYELVIPFFYRLSYVERYGLTAARNDLWKDHPHGDDGYLNHRLQMLEIVRRSRGRNKPCPCRSGRNYKNCCLAEVEHLGLESEDDSHIGSQGPVG